MRNAPKIPWLVVMIVLLGVLFRLTGINRPLLGNFSMYQTVNAAVAKFFESEGFRTLLYPQLNVMVQGKPGIMLLAYPVASFVAAVFHVLFGGSLDFWGRFQALFFFTLSCLVLYGLVRKLMNDRIAVISLIAFSLSPLSIIYGQALHNEMATVFFSLIFFYYWVIALEDGGLGPISASALGLSGTLATRPNALYLLIPALFLIFFGGARAQDLKRRFGRGAGVLILGVILPALWFWHIWHVSNSSPHIYSTVFAQLGVRSVFVSSLALRLNYYKELLDVLAGVTLTPIGFTLLLIGVLLMDKKSGHAWFFLLWAVSFLTSSLLIPKKLIDHNFYLLNFVVPASPLMALGFDRIADTLRRDSRAQGRIVAIFLLTAFLISFRYAYHPAFKTPEKEKNLLEIARQVNQHTDRETSRIVSQASQPLLYYADRLGWNFPMVTEREAPDYLKYMNWQELPKEQWQLRNEAMKKPVTYLEYLIKYEGATHFVVTVPSEFEAIPEFVRHLHHHYRVVSERPGQYIIFDLVHKK